MKQQNLADSQSCQACPTCGCEMKRGKVIGSFTFRPLDHDSQPWFTQLKNGMRSTLMTALAARCEKCGYLDIDFETIYRPSGNGGGPPMDIA